MKIELLKLDPTQYMYLLALHNITNANELSAGLLFILNYTYCWTHFYVRKFSKKAVPKGLRRMRSQGIMINELFANEIAGIN